MLRLICPDKYAVGRKRGEVAGFVPVRRRRMPGVEDRSYLSLVGSDIDSGLFGFGLQHRRSTANGADDGPDEHESQERGSQSH
jgi:hypothetical protein